MGKTKRQGHGGQGFQEENSQKFQMQGKDYKNQAENQLNLLEASGAQNMFTHSRFGTNVKSFLSLLDE